MFQWDFSLIKFSLLINTGMDDFDSHKVLHLGTHFDHPLDEAAVWKIFVYAYWTLLNSARSSAVLYLVCATGCLVCRRSKPLYALGYGLSFLICLVTVIVGVFLESSMLLETADGALPQQHYHENDVCWLNRSSYVWVFNSYVIAILLFNTAMLYLGARAYMRVSIKHASSIP